MPRTDRVFKKRSGGPGRKKNENENILVLEESVNNVGSEESVNNSDINVRLDTPMTSKSPTNNGPSSSRRKLFSKLPAYFEDVDKTEQSNNNNVILNLDILSKVLNSFVRCKFCNEDDSIVCYEDCTARFGLVSKLVLECNNCGTLQPFRTSSKTEKGYETNIRLVYGMRAIGKGQTSAQTLCAILNLPKPPTRFQKYQGYIHSALKEVAQESMSDAVKEAIDENEGSTDLSVALDGSWQKRGHKSLNGFVSATSVDNGKVIDVEIKTKYCHACSILKDSDKLEEHKRSDSCKINFEGVSGSMEAAGAVAIFSRSIEKYEVKYKKYLGDGDSKGFMKVLESKPYGEEKIEKLECICHVQKRMGTRLRKIRNEYKGKKLEDNKAISGKGRLSEKEIDTIQMYYGNAIRRNTNSLSNMKQDVWALYFHKLSTDEAPHHNLCPKGETSWCKYNRGLVTGEAYTHKHSLPVAVANVIKPVFRSLADPTLLGKCLHGKTQNPNECFNSVAWSRVPKTVFVGLQTLELGIYDSVVTYNDGNIGRVKVIQKLGIHPGTNMLKCFQEMDEVRIKRADLEAENVYKRARQHQRNKKRAREDDEAEEPEYGAGMY